MKKLSFIIAILFVASCSTSKTKLTDSAKNVRILTSQRNTDCNTVDKITGINNKGSVELAKNHARNLAARADGNAVYFEQVVHNGSEVQVHATAYDCR